MGVTRNFGHVDDKTTWHQLFSEFIFEVDRMRVGKAFWGTLRIRRFGDVQISHLRTSRIERLERPTPTAKQLLASSIVVILQLDGTGTLSQDGRSVSFQAGDLVCIDLERSVAWELSENCEVLLVHLPLCALNKALGTTEVFTSIKLNESYLLGSLLAAYLRSLTAQLGDVSEEVSYSLTQIALDLVIAVLAEHRDTNPSTGGGDVLRRAQAYIQMNSRDASLNPRAVAAALRISDRYLQKIFKQTGQTPRGYLLSCRLKNAGADLSNPNLSRASISEIAIRSGFTELTHFSQRFKAAYGESAREYRRRAKNSLRKEHARA